MLSLKSSLFVAIATLSFGAQAMFSEKECLDVAFEAEVSHKDKLTFGMAQTKLIVEKDKCEITISHEKLKFIKNKWKIDVCREPVHIKSGVKGVEVLKKIGSCPSKESADFCEAYKKIKEILQDDGLIFAAGEKENLSTDHGRIYCAYNLLDGYLGGGRIYSRYASNSKDMVTSPAAVAQPKVEATAAPSVDPTPPEDKQPSQGQSGSF